MKYFIIGVTFILLMFSCNKGNLEVQNNRLETLYFPPLDSSIWETSSIKNENWNENFLQELLDFVQEKNAKAFIILKNGKIVVEWYGNNFNKTDYWYWASAGKVLTASTIGIAEQEGKLHINDKTSDYLGLGWTNTTPKQENKITIFNQLTMTTGLNPTIFDCTKPECLLFAADASSRWAYHNAPYTLLQSVIAEATYTTFESYFNDKIRDKIGMDGIWKSTNNFNNVYFSTARSMARFGLLILNRGSWENNTVLNENYFNSMTYTSQNLNKSYGYLWWLNGKESYMLPQSQNVNDGYLIPNAPADLIAGLGKNDQKLYVIPSQNLVIIRMGEKANETSPVLTNFDNELWSKINKLIKK